MWSSNANLTLLGLLYATLYTSRLTKAVSRGNQRSIAAHKTKEVLTNKVILLIDVALYNQFLISL